MYLPNRLRQQLQNQGMYFSPNARFLMISFQLIISIYQTKKETKKTHIFAIKTFFIKFVIDLNYDLIIYGLLFLFFCQLEAKYKRKFEYFGAQNYFSLNFVKHLVLINFIIPNTQLKTLYLMDELFDEPRPARQGRGRNHDRKQKQQQLKNLKSLEKQFLFPALKIKCYGQTNQQFEQPLEQYVEFMYNQFDKKKHLKVIQSFQKQDDEGNIQYKLKLVNPTEDRLDHLATQMKFRVKQGSGEAYYRIGVQDNGRPLGLARDDMFQSLKTICYIASKIHTDVMVLRVSEGLKGLIVELMIRQIHKQGIKLEIRLLLFGDSGSGKSTLLGVLKSGQKDDGKGFCRLKVFTHPHQFLSGTTMTKSHHVIGFDSTGKLVNQQNMVSLQKWFDHVNKLLSFIDVGGHKKAQKQLVSSLCSFFPQYALWVVSGKQSPKTSSKFDTDHLQLAKVFNLPLIVVITHLDEMTKDEQIESVFNLKQFLKKLYPDKTPCVIKEMQYAVLFSRITSTQDVIPIFLTSSVTGRNIDLLTNFLNLLTSVSQIKNNEELHTQFMISDKYFLEKKIILAGTVIKGSIKKGQILHLGPDSKGSFRAVQVNSIECLRVPVKFAKCGQICTVGIKLNNFAKQWLQKEPNAIRRGMVLVESKSNPKAAHEFSAEFMLYHSNKQQIKITRKYQPVVNTLTIRQICSIVSAVSKKKQEELQIPGQLLKKKSKSIDNFEKYQSTSISKKNKLPKNHSMKNGLNSLSSKTMIEGMKKPLYKKSLDLTESQFNQIQSYSPTSPLRHSTQEFKISGLTETIKSDGLEIIEEEIKTKKKKQIEEIFISQNQPITLRLRFKYMPQYISVGQILVINELKLVGKIKEIFY